MKRTAFSPHNDIFVQYLKTDKKHNMSVQHYHDAYEIYLLLGGKRYFFYDNICYTMERGDLAVIKPFDIHYSESREVDEYERYVLNFHAEDLSVILNSEEQHFLSDKLKPCVMHLSEEQTNEILALLQRTDKLSGRHGFLARKMKYYAVMELILYVLDCTEKEASANGVSISPQILKAMEYINRSYKENMTLENIAAKANMSKFHFCHSFKNITGATVMEYVNNVRLTKVHNLLVNTDNTLEEIANETGMSSAVNLSRVFKKVYGVSPRAFRKEYRRE